MNISVFFYAVLMCLTALACPLQAKVYIDIHSPSSTRLPILVSPFRSTGSGQGKQQLAPAMARVLSDDLDFSGFFRLLDPGAVDDACLRGITASTIKWDALSIIGAETIVTGGIRSDRPGALSAELRLFDAVQGKFITGKKYSGSAGDHRIIMHRFADEIFRKLTGEKAIFTTRIAYVKSDGTKKEIYLMDYDGHGDAKFTRHGSLSLSPAWSPDGKHLAYTSYRDGNPDLYIQNTKTGVFKKMSRKKGINIAPSWSPRGGKIALTLSLNNGNSEIYTLAVRNGKLERLTHNWATDVSPSWSPDENKIAFVSSRSGTPQVYCLDQKRGRIKRLTFEGNYNTSPAWSPRGEWIAYTGRTNGKFNLHRVSDDGQFTQQLTVNQGNNEDPSWSPDGRCITFSSDRTGQKEIYIMRADGTGQKKVSHGPGEKADPAWSPL